MIKLLITATSFVLGGAGGALVCYLGANPLAFTDPVAAPPAVSPVAAAPVPVEPLVNAIVLPEIRITAFLAKPKNAVMPTRFGPCSAWNDVGAVFIEPTGATGVRQVRDLCYEPSDER